jgi:flavin-dependent dehydrogenase
LAGDSAGLAHPQSGEGILPAIQSGLLAAKTILAARGAYGQKALASYREGIAAPAESWAMSAVRRLPPRWIALAARNLLQTRWFVNEIVLKEWFLHAPLELRRHLPHPTV